MSSLEEQRAEIDKKIKERNAEIERKKRKDSVKAFWAGVLPGLILLFLIACLLMASGLKF